MSLVIRREEKSDERNNENLVREAFWNVYKPGCLEHYVLHVMRSSPGFINDLNFVMEEDGELIGQVVFHEAELVMKDGSKLPIATFGPIGIRPDKKKKNYGTVLLAYAMNKAREYGIKALLMEGNIGFYGKLGFTRACDKGILYHGETVDFLLCRELEKGYLSSCEGADYITPSIYYVDEAEAEKFDTSFPYKEKLKLEGQLFS